MPEVKDPQAPVITPAHRGVIVGVMECVILSRHSLLTQFMCTPKQVFGVNNTL